MMGRAATIDPSSWQEIIEFLQSLVVNNTNADRVQDDKLAGAAISGLKGQFQNGPSVTGRAASWAVGFDKLLGDTAGVATFSEFLKKEFSEENIIFWKQCEDYRKITDLSVRKEQAKEMHEKHIMSSALDPVNVDSHARQAVIQGLQQAAPSLFEDAQKQIFQLMKQDSYPRFLKSDLYKQCVVADMEGKPLPFGDDDKPHEKKAMKKIKSTSSTDDTVGEEKRRRSLLPWNRGKEKGEKRLSKMATDPDLRGKAIANNLDRVSLGGTSRQSLDLSETGYKDVEENGIAPNGTAQKESLGRLCRVLLPNGSSTVLNCVTGQTVQDSLAKLCHKRNISLLHMEAIYASSDRAVDVLQDLHCLGSQEIRLVRRVVFRLDLQGRKSVVVRVMPTRTIRDVLQSLLVRYNFKVDNMVVHTHGSGTSVDPESSVSAVEDQRLIVQTVEDFAGKKKKDWGGFSFHKSSTKPGQHRSSTRPETPRSAGGVAEDASSINDLLKDLLDGQANSAVVFDDLGVWDPDKKDVDKAKPDGRGSGVFSFIRRNSIGEREGAKVKNKSRGTIASLRPAVVPRSIPGMKPTKMDKEEEKFLQLLTRAQSRQMDDQRGISKLNLELPDFLKISEPGDDNGTQAKLRRTELHNSDSSLYEKVTDERRMSRSQEGLHIVSRTSSMNVSDRSQVSQQTATPHKLSYMDQSFSKEGVVPSHCEAEEYFSQIHALIDSPNFNDSHLMDRSLRDIGLYGSLRSTSSFKMRPGDEHGVLAARPSVPARQHPPTQPDSTGNGQSSNNTTITPVSAGSLDSTLVQSSAGTAQQTPAPTAQPKVIAQELMETEMPNYPPPTPVQAQGEQGSVVPKRLAHFTARAHLQFQANQSASTTQGESDLECDVKESELAPAGPGRSQSTPSPTTHDLVLESGTDSPPQIRRHLPKEIVSKSVIDSAEVQISMV